VICSAEGRTSRLAPLAVRLQRLGGATNLWHSCTRLQEAHPDRLLPSRGGGPIDDPAAAISAFKANLRRIDEIIPGFAAGLKELGDEADDTDEVLPRLLLSRHGEAKTHFIVSRAGDRVLALDYGYHSTAAVFPAVHHRSNRRPLLHGMKGLKRRWGVDRIDTVLVSHYHDDHVNGIPLLQRLWGTEVWAADHFADILRRPERYDRPCLWHEPIDVTRALPCGETFHWDDVAITLHPMSGHTRFSSLLCLEIDGTRVVHTGDQIFFDPWEFAPGARLFTNHVYKNGLDLGCYGQTLDHLRRFRPEVVLTGHTQPYRTTDEWYNVIARGAQAFDDVHRLLLPLGDDEVHFGPESQGGKLKPYRAHLPDVPAAGGARIAFDGWVLNPFPTEQPASVRLVAPEGWESEPLEVTLGPREQQEIRLSLAVPAGTRCRRQPVGLDLTVGGQPFGQVAEALVTAGMPHF
jgi:glyoxylase-like metal-dependent hydrolase (beta-lactamase superfamily II)